MNLPLTVLLAVLVLGYAAYLASRMLRHKGRCGSCSACPYAGGCRMTKRP